MSGLNRQIFVKELPKDRLEESHFEPREAPIPEAGEGEVLAKTLYCSLDAANRAWMQGATYTAPVKAGEVMRGGNLAEIVASKAPGLEPGDIVECQSGWQEYAVHKPESLLKIDVRGALTNHLSVYGVTGLTAYYGLLEIGQPQKGETLVVSAAAGAVGNVVGQIGKIKGCRVVGIAGSDEKCQWLTGELGFDDAINYKSGSIFSALKKHCPSGIDVYFDNVGGETLEAVLARMNLHGRIACCGVVSQYDTGNPAGGPRGVPGLLVVKRIKMEGFIVMDYYRTREKTLDEIAGWVSSGQLKVKEDIVEGLENAPRALIGLLHGENIGKRMVHVADPS